MKKHFNHLTSLLCLLSLLSGHQAVAQSGEVFNPNYHRGETVLEKTLPPAPEAASRVKYADVPFTHSMGLAEYEVAFSTLKGRELSIPISLRYRSGGIKLDEIAGVAGLGWTLCAGGCITRTVCDMPDEFVSQKPGMMRHQLPSGSLLTALEDNWQNNGFNSDAHRYLVDLVWHQVDAKLDRYSYDVCGLSGSFVILDNGSIGYLSGDGAKIEYQRDTTGAPSVFTITGPDGTVYTLGAVETGHHDGNGRKLTPMPSGEPDVWDAYTSWHLTRVQSRSGLESAVFEYESAGEWKQDVKSKTWTWSKVVYSNPIIDNRDSFSSELSIIRHSYEVKKLKSIRLGQFTVTFQYADWTGKTNHNNDTQNYPVRLTGIALRHSTEGCLDSLVVGTARHAKDGRIVLNSLRRYRCGELDDRWDFSYWDYPINTDYVYFSSQDWYGYFNYAVEGERPPIIIVHPPISGGAGTVAPDDPIGGGDTGSSQGVSAATTICPYSLDISNISVNPTRGTPDPSHSNFLSLKAVNHDGAITSFEYEGNSLNSNQHPIGVRVKSITIADAEGPRKVRNFSYDGIIYDGPTSPIVNDYLTTSPPGDLNMADSQSWSITLHETPVETGRSVRDTRVYYGKVTETCAGSRTDYQYSWFRLGGENTIYRFPESAEDTYNSVVSQHPTFELWRGVRNGYGPVGPSPTPLLTSRTDYSRDATGGWKKVSSDEYTYPQNQAERILLSYIAHLVNRNTVGIAAPNPGDIYHYPVWGFSAPERRPESILHVEYHPSGNDSTLVHTAYLPRSSLDEPLRPQSVSYVEGGVRRKLEYTYPDTYGPQLRPLSQGIASGGFVTIVTWYDLLADQHCLNVPLRTDYYVEAESDSLSATPLRSEHTEYGYFRIPIPGGFRNVLFPKVHKEQYLGTECWRETIQERDWFGNPTKVKEKGKPLTEIEWGYNGLYPVEIKQDSLVSTFTYRPGIGLTSSTSPSGIVTNYDYDHAGRMTAIRDAQGRAMQSWEYHLFNNGGDGLLHRRHRTYRNANGSAYGEDVRWWNTLGLILQDQVVGGSGDGRNLVTAYQADSLLHEDARVWLPYPVADTTFAYHPDAVSQAIDFHGDSLAYNAKTYERSARNKVKREALPGYDGSHETVYSEGICQDGFPQLLWEDATGITQQGSYRPSEVVCRTTTDADGRQKRTFSDHAGRTLATVSGVDSLTWFVYDRYDNLRAVAGGGIAFSDTLSMWRYSYDSVGRMASKGIPGSVREFYTYDNEDRVIAVRRGEYLTETDYDAHGRPLRVYLTDGSSSRRLIEQHGYTADRETSASYAVLSALASDDGCISYTYEYDDRGRRTKSIATFPEGDILTEITAYNFAAEVVYTSATSNAAGPAYSVAVSTQLDMTGRKLASDATLVKTLDTLKAISLEYAYDAIGRPCGKTVADPFTQYSITTQDNLNLQGWLTQRLVKKNGVNYFGERLGYNDSYTGLLRTRSSGWVMANGIVVFPPSDTYSYDASGRLAEENTSSSVTSYSYDSRGNIVSEAINSNGTVSTINSSYNGDRLKNRGDRAFAHDEYGRMIEDGQSGIELISYNALNLPQQMSLSDTVSFSFRYGAQGDKLDVLRTDGSGLVYRGPFVYRRIPDGALTLESAACPEGRISTGAAMVYVTDYLGSVREVLDASDGTVYETSSYSAYGLHTQGALSPPSGTTLRDHYTGCEDFAPEFGLPYTDHSARFYSASLHRWLVPDPQSEKYYGVSPYAYCGGNPLGATDREGEVPHIIVGAIIGGAVGGIVDACIAYSQGKPGNEVLGAAVSGMINGASIVAFGSAKLGVQIAAGVVTGALSNAADQGISTGTVELGEVAESALSGGIFSAAGAGITNLFDNRVTASIRSSIQNKYSSTATKATIKREVTNELKASGRSTSGSAGVNRVNQATKARIKTLEAVDNAAVDMTQQTVDYSVQMIMTELANSVLEEYEK